MFGELEIFKMASGMATNAVARHSVIARNVANADTPGYRAQDIASFADSYKSENSSQALRATRAGHVGAASGSAGTPRAFETADATSPNGNSVSLETEMVRASAARQQHELALSIYSSSLDILRASLGRR